MFTVAAPLVTVTGPAGYAANPTVYVFVLPTTVSTHRLTTPASGSVTLTASVSAASPV